MAHYSPMERLRIGLVTDMHVGPLRSNIRSDKATGLLEDAIAAANAQPLDLLVCLGDSILATDPEEDRKNLARVHASLGKSRVPVVAVLGNNETKFLNPGEAARVLHASADSHVQTIKGWTLAFWQAACNLPLEGSMSLRAADLAWLEETLAAAAYPVVVFSHVPLDGHSMIGNHYFENRVDLAGYVNASEARARIEASGKVVAAIAGHVHWNTHSIIGGVAYIALQSIADTFADGGQPSAAWAVLELDETGISLEVFGHEPLRLWQPLRAPQTRWRPPLSHRDFDSRMRKMWGETVALKDP